MGNDDIQVFDGIAHLSIIDISCPNQLLGFMKWIMEELRSIGDTLETRVAHDLWPLPTYRELITLR